MGAGGGGSLLTLRSTEMFTYNLEPEAFLSWRPDRNADSG